jgi:hypothetical protein
MSIDKQAARDLAIARRCFSYGMHHGGERVTNECLMALVAAVDASLGGVGPEHLHYCSRCRRIGRKEGASDAKREAVRILKGVQMLTVNGGPCWCGRMQEQSRWPHAPRPYHTATCKAARAYCAAAEADAAEENPMRKEWLERLGAEDAAEEGKP